MKKHKLFDELMAGAGVETLKQEWKSELDKLLIERLAKVGQGVIPAEVVRQNIIESLRSVARNDSLL